MIKDIFVHFLSTSSSQNNVSIISSCSLGRMIGILYKQSSESSGKRKNKAATPGSHSFVTMIDTANITDKGWENLQSDELGNVSIPLGSVEGTYLLTSHFPNNAVSVIFPDSSSSYRWIKLSPLGETLLSVELNVSPIYSLGTANTLSIICSNSFASWNIHYGVQYSQKSTLNSIFSSFNSAFLPLFHVSTDSTIAVYFGNREDTGDSSTTYCLQRLLLRVDESPAFQLINSDLFEGKHSPHTSLGSLIGSLKKRPLESDFQPPQTGRTRRKSSATEDGILNRLDESKRNLLLRLISEDICVDLTLQDACESFLRCGDSVAALTKVDAVLKIWTESDWKVFDVLVSLKIVGLNSYPALFTFLLEAAKTSFDLR